MSHFEQYCFMKLVHSYCDLLEQVCLKARYSSTFADCLRLLTIFCNAHLPSLIPSALSLCFLTFLSKNCLMCSKTYFLLTNRSKIIFASVHPYSSTSFLSYYSNLYFLSNFKFNSTFATCYFIVFSVKIG